MSRRARSLLTGLAAALAFVLADLLLCRTRPGQRLDAAAFSLVLNTLPAPLKALFGTMARPALVLAIAAVLVWLGARSLRTEPRRVAVAALCLVAVPIAYGIRTSWDRPDLGVPGYLPNTYPSTHATAGIAILIACLVLWPRRLGRVEGWAAMVITLVFLVGNVSEHAHRPADVLGSALLALAAAALASGLVDVPLLRLRPAWKTPDPLPQPEGGRSRAHRVP